MADRSIRGLDCGECDEHGERGERGKRGHRGHDGATGATGATGAAGPSTPTTLLVTLADYTGPIGLYRPGAPVRVTTATPDVGTVAAVNPASNSSIANALVIGLIKQIAPDGNPNHALIQVDGVLELTVPEWNAVTGNQGLVPSEARWVSTLGMLDDVPPSTPGQFEGQVGACLSATQLLLSLPAVLIAV